ncbi:MAG: glycosyltransferase family 9 protein [Bacteroidota bacterium]|nr:glycosyltransferase family 9 protein [Bacteroidota bacterium]
MSAIIYHSKRAIVNIFCFCLDAFITSHTSKIKQKPSKKQVLLIRIDAIGDFIIWTSTLPGYRQLYPKETHEITLVGHESWLSLAIKSGFFNHTFGIDRKKLMLDFKYRLQIMSQISKWKAFDTVIYHTYSREFASGDLLVKKIKSKHKISIKSDEAIDINFWHNISNSWYSELKIPMVKGIHELFKNEAFIQSLGIQDYQISLPDLNYLKVKLNQKLPEKYYVLFPGARVHLRQWPEDKFAEIAKKIFQKYKLIGVICGSENEYNLGESIKNSSEAPLINLSGNTSLEELINIIAHASFLIGNETSGIHISVAMNVPSICILGGGHFGRFAPYPVHFLNKSAAQFNTTFPMPCYNCDWNCKFQINKTDVVPCIKNIEEDQVWNQVLKLISE